MLYMFNCHIMYLPFAKHIIQYLCLLRYAHGNREISLKMNNYQQNKMQCWMTNLTDQINYRYGTIFEGWWSNILNHRTTIP